MRALRQGKGSRISGGGFTLRGVGKSSGFRWGRDASLAEGAIAFPPYRIFLRFQHHDGQARTFQPNGQCGADRTAADDGNINVLHGA
jgi:hypothetical protein